MDAKLCQSSKQILLLCEPPPCAMFKWEVMPLGCGTVCSNTKPGLSFMLETQRGNGPFGLPRPHRPEIPAHYPTRTRGILHLYQANSSTNPSVFGDWEETEDHGENPCGHGENEQTA